MQVTFGLTLALNLAPSSLGNHHLKLDKYCHLILIQALLSSPWLILIFGLHPRESSIILKCSSHCIWSRVFADLFIYIGLCKGIRII